MSSRRPWRLVLGLWGTYWALLAAFALGPLALAILRATSGPENQTSSVNVSFGNGGLSATVVNRGATTYSATVQIVTMALWIAGPPLVAWLAIALREKNRHREAERV